jgi:hypothetical protein
MRRIAILGVCLALGGCETAEGVMREAQLDTVPDMGCVRRAVEAAPGGAKVTFIADPGSVYDFDFEGAPGSKVRGAVQLFEYRKGRFRYFASILQINSPPPQDIVDASRPVMRDVEQTIAVKCGLGELLPRVRETCANVACAPLHSD